MSLHLQGKLDAATASMAKYWTTEKQCEIIDRCLQVFGGYGYMLEYPIARMYAAARVQKIYGGAKRDHEGAGGAHALTPLGVAGASIAASTETDCRNPLYGWVLLLVVEASKGPTSSVLLFVPVKERPQHSIADIGLLDRRHSPGAVDCSLAWRVEPRVERERPGWCR
jgi:hypothetical protein